MDMTVTLTKIIGLLKTPGHLNGVKMDTLELKKLMFMEKDNVVF